MSENDDDFILINPDDFKSFEITVGFRNATTDTAVQGETKSQKDYVDSNSDKDQSISLIEFEEETLKLSIPTYLCASGHSVEIQLVVEGAGAPLLIDILGKVESVNSTDDEDRQEAQINLTDYDKDRWKALRDLYGKRQDDINEFLKAARGF